MELAPHESERLEAASAPSSVRLLVVEDNRVSQEIARHFLQKLGYAADMASNGREALAAWECNPYDIVLMDCLMPEMDGFEATKAIRQKEAHGTHRTVI